MPIEQVIRRFWERVDVSGECWLWISSVRGKKKYGFVQLRDAAKIAAHRLSYVLSFGRIPNGLWVLHKCDNPRCVRPDHLFLGTSDDNVADMVSKGRHPRGTTNGRAKLSAAQVLEIVRRSKDEFLTHLAKEFRVGPAHIGQITRGEKWSSVTGIVYRPRVGVKKFAEVS